MDRILANRQLTMASEEVPPSVSTAVYVKSRMEPRVTEEEEREEGVRVEELSLQSVEVESESDTEEVAVPKQRSQSTGVLETGHYQVPTMVSVRMPACVPVSRASTRTLLCVCRCPEKRKRHTSTCLLWTPGATM